MPLLCQMTGRNGDMLPKDMKRKKYNTHPVMEDAVNMLL